MVDFLQHRPHLHSFDLQETEDQQQCGTGRYLS